MGNCRQWIAVEKLETIPMILFYGFADAHYERI
jgi:hypothetical protein